MLFDFTGRVDGSDDTLAQFPDNIVRPSVQNEKCVGIFERNSTLCRSIENVYTNFAVTTYGRVSAQQNQG